MGRGSEELNDDERRLIRLFRCMDETEQAETLTEAAKRLMRRCSVDPYLGRFELVEQTLARELAPAAVDDSGKWRLDACLRRGSDTPGRRRRVSRRTLKETQHEL